MKVFDVLGTGAKKAVDAVRVAIAGAPSTPAHRCDGFHCDCQRRREVDEQSRDAGGAWLKGRSGWLKREE